MECTVYSVECTVRTLQDEHCTWKHAADSLEAQSLRREKEWKEKWEGEEQSWLRVGNIWGKHY